MANMKYVRFENTYRDLAECYEAMEENLSESEAEFRKKLIELCKNIADEFGDED